MRFQLFSILFLPLFALAASEDQAVLRGPLQMPESKEALVHEQPTLADLLTIEPSASIFYSYARELELSQLFGNVGVNHTLLVPTNKAVMALARKPHQGSAPVDDGITISEAEFDSMSKKNVERWVSAHIIPEHPISFATGAYETLLPGNPVHFKQVEGNSGTPAWARVVLNDQTHITSVKKAANGALYMIDGTVKVD